MVMTKPNQNSSHLNCLNTNTNYQQWKKKGTPINSLLESSNKLYKAIKMKWMKENLKP